MNSTRVYPTDDEGIEVIDNAELNPSDNNHLKISDLEVSSASHSSDALRIKGLKPTTRYSSQLESAIVLLYSTYLVSQRFTAVEAGYSLVESAEGGYMRTGVTAGGAVNAALTNLGRTIFRYLDDHLLVFANKFISYDVQGKWSYLLNQVLTNRTAQPGKNNSPISEFHELLYDERNRKPIKLVGTGKYSNIPLSDIIYSIATSVSHDFKSAPIDLVSFTTNRVGRLFNQLGESMLDLDSPEDVTRFMLLASTVDRLGYLYRNSIYFLIMNGLKTNKIKITIPDEFSIKNIYAEFGRKIEDLSRFSALMKSVNSVDKIGEIIDADNADVSGKLLMWSNRYKNCNDYAVSIVLI